MKKRILPIILVLCMIVGGSLAYVKISRQQKVITQLAVQLNSPTNQIDAMPNLRPYDEEKWLLTQYGEIDKERQICYTVTSSNGLVIIDGGFEYEVPRLRKIIASYGNHVDAWILTHPDSDHITAFMEIYKDLQGITIDKVYTPEYPSIDILKKMPPGTALKHWKNFVA